MTIVAGLHLGCYELIAHDHVRSIAGLKGRTVGWVPWDPSSKILVFLMAKSVGLDPSKDTAPADAAELVRQAVAFWAAPAISAPVRGALERYAGDVLAAATKPWMKAQYPVLALNALRMLVATSPDYLTS